MYIYIIFLILMELLSMMGLRIDKTTSERLFIRILTRVRRKDVSDRLS